MIQFGTIEIVELPIIIGDNPSTIGVPIAVDWWFCSEEDDDENDVTSNKETHSHRHCCIHPIPDDLKTVVSLDLFEQQRPTRRSRRQLHWSRQAREEMLLRNGFTEQQIRLAEFEGLIIRRSRRLSQLDKEEDWEEEANDKFYDEKYTNELCKERLIRSSNSNLSEEMSPVKNRRHLSTNNALMLQQLPSSAPLSPPPTTMNSISTIWRSGGSPDQPLRGAPRRSSDDVIVDSRAELLLMTTNESDSGDLDDERRHEEGNSTPSSITVPDHAFRSADSSSFSRTSFDRMVASLPPMQPLVIPARTA